MKIRELVAKFSKVVEASLPMNTSYDALRGQLDKALMEAHGITSRWDSNGPWIHGGGVFPENVVYDLGGQTYRRKYTVTQGASGAEPTISLGNPKKCHAAYMDSAAEAQESVIITLESAQPEPGTEQVQESGESIICMTEAEFSAVKESGISTFPVKVIKAGWGSSAYYSKEVLKRDGPGVFSKGTHMYWNHATPTEEAERPEGDLSNLAAVLTEDAHWDENGPKGPGLYSKAKVFSDYATQVAEKGAHIGVSINAAIRFHEGTADGRTGRIADQFVKAYSVDFVTKAGAGGAPIVPARESAGASPNNQELTMTPEEIKALQDSKRALEAQVQTLTTELSTLKSENASLKEAQNQVLAVAAVGTVLREAGISVGHKVIERMCASPVMKDGKPDASWIESVVKDLAESFGGGSITDMGEGHNRQPNGSASTKIAESIKATLESLGVPKAGLEVAARG